MHSHAHDSRRTRLALVLCLTLTYLAVEVAVGFFSGSLSLLADAAHTASDAFGIALMLAAFWAAMRPATPRRSYGLYRTEILATLANGAFLLAMSVVILIEAVRRLDSPPEVDGLPMLAAAVCAGAANLVAFFLLRGEAGESLGMRSVLLDVAADALGALGVIIAALVITVTGWNVIDPIVSIGIVLIIAPRCWQLLYETVNLLLEGAPQRVNVSHVQDHILGTQGVVGLHDLHIWSVTSGLDVISAHVVVDEKAEPQRVLDDLAACLSDHFDIEHSTFQIEQPDRRGTERQAH